MRNAKSRLYAAAIGVLSMGAAGAWAAEPTAADLKIQQLEAKVAALETKQAANSKDLAATIDQVLRDAEKRSQLLATSGDMAAGYDNGFFIKAGDAFVFRPGVFFQFRYVGNYRDGAEGNNDSWDSGFDVRRLKLELQGTLLTRDLEYFFAWNTDDDDGTMFLEDAWAKYMFADEWGLRAGQFKDPLSHEWLMHDGRQLAVERSLVDALLGGGWVGRTQGVTLIYGGYNPKNPLNVEAGVTDGPSQLNTNFVGRPHPLPDPEPTVPSLGTPGPHEFDFGVAGRAEYKFMGNWNSYRDFSAMNNKEDLLVVGAAGDWAQAGNGNAFTATIDAQYENTAGLGVYGAGYYRRLDEEMTHAGESAADWGALIQAGYMLTNQYEIFGRYDITLTDSDFQTDNNFHELTVGVNYYLGTNGSAGHRAKITVDLTYLPNGAPVPAPGLGILDNNESQWEWIVRAQFQLWI